MQSGTSLIPVASCRVTSAVVKSNCAMLHILAYAYRVIRTKAKRDKRGSARGVLWYVASFVPCDGE